MIFCGYYINGGNKTGSITLFFLITGRKYSGVACGLKNKKNEIVRDGTT